MSIHFAPQWVKPIKPSGTSLTPTTEQPRSAGSGAAFPTNAHTVPFPALSQAQRSASPSTATQGQGQAQQPLSYSRVTHTPLSPSFPPDGSYFPYTADTPNGNGLGGLGNGGQNAHPFRYNRDQILALFDEAKFKERPIELVEMAEGGAVLVSKSVNRPVGLREHSEVEKKLLTTSVHPPMPTRRQMTHPTTAPPAEQPQTPNGLPSRRIAGFARGEGGAFGGGIGGKIGTIGVGILSPSTDVKAPGALGGGFGGVAKRLGRGRAETGEIGQEGIRTGPNWRPARTTSGSFEGVLGFGNTAAPVPAALLSPSAETVDQRRLVETPTEKPEGGEEKKEVEGIKFGNGGGPGWGTGQKKWRIAAGLSTKGEGEKTLEVPMSLEEGSASVIATPSATPVPDRDATLLESTPAPAGRPRQVNGSQDPNMPGSAPPQPEEREDLGAVEWYYRDPNGQEQGPFTGTQMHDWYSHSYFTDDLPLRRSAETTFRPLADLKVVTGNAVQPFLSPVRPRQLPPNLPIPIAALQQPINGHLQSLPESFRNLNVQNAGGVDAPPMPQQYAPGYPGGNPAFSPNAYAPQPYAGQVPPAPYSPSVGQQWNNLAPRLNSLNSTFGSIGMPSPIGQNALPFIHQQQQQQFFSPQVGSPVQRVPDMFSPSVGVGAVPNSPWAIPQPQPQPSPSYHQPQMLQQPSSMPWPAPVPEQQQQQQDQQAQQQQQDQIDVSAASENPVAIAVEEATPAPAPTKELAPEAPAVADVDQEEPVASSEVEADAATPAEDNTPSAGSPVATPAKATPPPSVWGQKTVPGSKPSSRKPSIAEAPASTDSPTPAEAVPAPASKLPAAPASLPAKPTTANRKASVSELPKTVAPATPGPTASASAEKPTPTTKTAPWALAKEDKDVKAVAASPSLREIQEAEARQAEARRQLLAEARAASASPAPVLASSDDFPTSMAWGLPSQNSKAPAASSPATPSTPTIPAWGSGDAGPKKTLKQIQEEEEKRRAKAAQATRVAQGVVGAGVAGPKRGYADLAANPAVPVPGWSTIGSGGKVVPGATSSTSAPASRVVTPASKPSIITAKPVIATVAPPTIVAKKANGVDDAAAPSVEFIRWTKQALTGLTVNVDEFIQMLLTFPIDPPASSRADQLEIVSDSVYASSSTLDGRRFAQEFYTKRKADAARPAIGTGGKAAVAKISSLADVVKTLPKAPSADLGFKVVKAKGKKK